MWMKMTAAGLLVSVAAISFASEDEHRQHGAHLHGSGQMNVALDKSRLMLELSIPAHDLIGFEHEPETPEQHEKLDQAVTRLRDALVLFTPNAEAKCTLKDADVESELLEEDHAEEGHHEEGHHEADHHEADHHEEAHDHENAEHDDDHDEHHEEHEAHSEFDLAYEFSCQQPQQLKQLTLNLFQHFPGIETLSVQLIGPAGQSATKLTPKAPVLPLR